MKRRNFLSLSATYTGGVMLLPNFLHALGNQPSGTDNGQCLLFIQLNGGNDGLNTYIPYSDPLYREHRPTIGFSKDDVINKNNGMGFHPSLSGLAHIQQSGDLTVLQNVGYPAPNRSHFRSQEIWQTASRSDEYLNNGWLGRYLDLQCDGHQPTAGINIDTIDNLSLKGKMPNSITVKNVNRYKTNGQWDPEKKLSGHPQLDFARTIAQSINEGTEEIQSALKKSKEGISYPKSGLGNNLKWMARLIKGNLNAKVYYTSMGGFDTHNNQLGIHKNKLAELNDAVFSFYKDIKQAGLLAQTTLVIFSEFGRRVRDNGSGTDHGTAAPMFIIGGRNKGKVLGPNPDLAHLDNGDLVYKIDFRDVYAGLLKNRLNFNPEQIGIRNLPLKGMF